MKIVIAAEIFPPDIGGPATYARGLAESLLEQGQSVQVLTYGEMRSTFPFPVFFVSRRIPFFLRQFVYFVKLLQTGWSADLVYAQGPSVGPAAVYLKRIRSTRVVVKYPGDQAWQQLRVRGVKIGYEEFMSSYGKRWWGWKLAWVVGWQKFSMLNADRVVVPSEYLKTILIRYLEVPADRMVTIPNGVMLQENPKRMTGIQNILYVGRIENWKGLDVVMAALAHLPDWTFTVVGDGHERGPYEDLARRMGVARRVVFVERASHRELAQYFFQAFCFVLGSEYEGMAHTLIEAWSFKVPVVVSDFPANTELVKDGVTGLVFKLHDAEDLVAKIRKLADDPILYEKLSNTGYEEHKKYDKTMIMKRTIEFLESAI